jgi:hypothetical protein
LRKKYGNNSIYNNLKKNQMPRNKLNKECKWPLQGELQTSEERDWGRLQRWKGLPWSWFARINIEKMAVIPKWIYWLNAISIDIPITFITGVKNSTLKLVHLETKRPRTAKGNTEQKEQWWRYHNIWLQAILQNHSNKTSMALAQKQIWRLVEQNRGSVYEDAMKKKPS